MKLKRALEEGVQLRGWRNPLCPKGHLKEGENAEIKRSGYRNCLECGRERARLRARRVRGWKGRIYKRRVKDEDAGMG